MIFLRSLGFSAYERALVRAAFFVASLAAPPIIAQPSPSRLDEIHRRVDFMSETKMTENVKFQENSEIPGPAWSAELSDGSFLIEYNDALLRSFAPSVKKLILYHELGHVRLKHHALLKINPQLAEDLELEADSFAAFAFRKANSVDRGLLDFFEFMSTQIETIPSGPVRVKLFRSLLQL